MKFKPTFADKFKAMNKDMVKFADTFKAMIKAMNKDMVKAREGKRKELEDKYIPDSVRNVLTPEEVQRSSSIGIFIGLAILLAIIIGIVGWVIL